MNWIKWIILFGILIISHSSFGLDTLFITADFQKIDMKEVSSLLESADEAWSIQRVKEIKHKNFTPLKETGIALIASKNIYWIKTVIKNEDTIARRIIIKVDNPRINKLKFFEVKKNHIKASPLQGDDFPFYQRSIINRNFLHSILLEPNETIDFYIYANKIGENINLFMSVWDNVYFQEFDNQEVTLWAFYLGFSFCITLIVVFITFFTRLKLFIYFSIYCLSLTLNLASWLGLGYKYIWFNFPFLNDISGYTFVVIYSICLIAMTRNYLKISVNFPKMDIILKIHQLILISLYPILIFYKILPKTVGIVAALFGNTVMLSYLILIILVTVLTYLKTKKRENLFFLFGFAFFIVGFGLHVSTTINLIEVNFWTKYGAGIGWTLDLIILMFVFSNQIQQTYLQNAQLNIQLHKAKLDAANALLSGQIEERQRLSTDLHDSISVNLSILKMQLQNLFLKFKLSQENEAQKAVFSISKITSDIRNFTHAILPINFSLQTFQDGVTDLVFNIEEQFNLTITLDFNAFFEEKISDQSQQILYQTIQELLNNTIKYANATTILMALKTLENGKIVLEYRDNGCGFDVQNVKKGIGLKNMEARAKLLNGDFEIQSNEKGSWFSFSILNILT